MGSIIGHRIDYNDGRGSERPAAHTKQKLPQVPPAPRGLAGNLSSVLDHAVSNSHKKEACFLFED